MLLRLTLLAVIGRNADVAGFSSFVPSTHHRRGFGSSSSSSSTSTSTTSSSTSPSLLRSEPSDTASDDWEDYFDDVVTVQSEDYEPGSREASVSSMMDLIPDQLGEVNSETRTAINEALYKMEALNPTSESTMSPLLNGVWELQYVGGYTPDWALPSPTRQLALFLYSGGYSPGIFALSLAQKLPSNLVEVGDLEITINREQPRVEAFISAKIFGGFESEVRVKARLEVQSDLRLKETYESASVLGQDIELPEPLQYSRDLYVTYVDEDLLVVRDGSGIPEVLVRKEKTFSQNWGTEPSDVDDMAPPGEES